MSPRNSVAARADLEATAKELFDVVLSGKVRIDIHQLTLSKTHNSCIATWKIAKLRGGF